jgi:1-acyl-sn-glycerol-3-phosphate acyltransferase
LHPSSHEPAPPPVRPPERGQFHLVGERRFGPFFVTQFLGALNDNFFKQALIALVTFQAATLTSMPPAVAVNIASGVFILPFFIFSATAGQLADKYEKSRIIRVLKLMEIAVMGLGAVGFWLHSLPLLLTALFMMGVQSAFFGPVKYSILPQHLKPHELVGGNALVESGTFLAILLGTIAGGLAVGAPNGTSAVVSSTIMALAVLGYLVCLRVPSAPAADAALRINWNPVTETWRNLRFAVKNPVVFKSILAASWFWFYGALFLAQMPVFAKDYLGGGEGVVVTLLTVFSVGIGLGSLACERLSGHKVEIGLVPFGSIGLTLFALDLWLASPALPGAASVVLGDFLAQPSTWRMLFDLFMIGLFGGFFIVPIFALIQTRSDPQSLSRTIGCNNIMNALFMVVAAGLGAGLAALGWTIPQLFLLTALLNAAVAVYVYKQVPEFLMRFLAWLLVTVLYRVDKTGLEHVPDEGPAVIVCNHVSFVDAVVVMGTVRRPIRFVMDHEIFKTPVLKFVFREARAIPIASAKVDPELLERAYEEIGKALDAGELVGIFPEGRITDTGELYPFRNGITRIVQRNPVPVVPLALRGLWGSFFSRVEGRAMKKPFRRGLFSKIGLVVAPAWPPERVTPEGLQEQVRALRGDWK